MANESDYSGVNDWAIYPSTSPLGPTTTTTTATPTTTTTPTPTPTPTATPTYTVPDSSSYTVPTTTAPTTLGGTTVAGENTTTQTNEPWSAVQPYLKEAYSGATEMYNNDAMWSPYTGQMVVGMDPYTTQAMQGIESTAGQYHDAMQNPMQFNQYMYDQGGLTPEQQQAMATYSGLASGTGMNTQQTDAYNSMSGLNNYLYGTGGLSPYQQNAADGYGDIMDAGGLSSQQLQAQQGFEGMLGGLSQEQLQALQGYQGMTGGLSDAQRIALEQSQGIAAGNELQGNDPGFDSVLKQAQDSAMNAVNSGAMQAGRYGSGAHQGVMGREVGDLSARMLSDNYKMQLGRQDAARQNNFGWGQRQFGNSMDVLGAQANLGQQRYGNQANMYGQIGNIGQQGLANYSNALASQGQLGQAGIDNQMGTATSMYDMGQGAYDNQTNALDQTYQMGQQGIQNQFNASQDAQAAYNTSQQSYRDMLGLGGMNEDLQRRTLEDQARQYYENRDQSKDALNTYNSWLSGAGGLGSTQTRTEPKKAEPSTFQSMLSGGLSGYNMTGDLWGTALGGLGGYFS